MKLGALALLCYSSLLLLLICNYICNTYNFLIRIIRDKTFYVSIIFTNKKFLPEFITTVVLRGMFKQMCKRDFNDYSSFDNASLTM